MRVGFAATSFRGLRGAMGLGCFTEAAGIACEARSSSQRKRWWQICYNTCVWHQACNRCVLSSAVQMPPSAAGKDAPVGGLRAAYARATAYLRCSLPYYMPSKRLRLNDCPLFVKFSAPNSTQAASRVCMQITPEFLGWNTCTSPT
jgi:hypothetical protein